MYERRIESWEEDHCDLAQTGACRLLMATAPGSSSPQAVCALGSDQRCAGPDHGLTSLLHRISPHLTNTTAHGLWLTHEEFARAAKHPIAFPAQFLQLCAVDKSTHGTAGQDTLGATCGKRSLSCVICSSRCGAPRLLGPRAGVQGAGKRCGGKLGRCAEPKRHQPAAQQGAGPFRRPPRAQGWIQKFQLRKRRCLRERRPSVPAGVRERPPGRLPGARPRQPTAARQHGLRWPPQPPWRAQP